MPADQIPQIMRDAIVAVEDKRFYEHSGVDFVAILRAVWADIRNREIAQGGSTITQQLTKNAYIGNDPTFERKLRESCSGLPTGEEVVEGEDPQRVPERRVLR